MKLKRGLKIFGAIVVLLLVGLAIWLGPVVAALWRSGILPDMLTEEEKVRYKAGREENLRALQTALMQYHDSEDGFPPAEIWMDAIEPYIVTADLAKGEAKKKLSRPDLLDYPEKYGYAMNEQIAGAFIDDIEEGTILIYESEMTERNAFGSPPEGATGVTARGELRELETNGS